MRTIFSFIVHYGLENLTLIFLHFVTSDIYKVDNFSSNHSQSHRTLWFQASIYSCIKFLFNILRSVQLSSVAQSCPTLRPHELQHARPPCPSPTPGVHPNPGPLSQWCHPTISSSVAPFFFCPQSFPASASFQMSQLFTSGSQSIGVSVSTSVLPMNTQNWLSRRNQLCFSSENRQQTFLIAFFISVFLRV